MISPPLVLSHLSRDSRNEIASDNQRLKAAESNERLCKCDGDGDGDREPRDTRRQCHDTLQLTAYWETNLFLYNKRLG